MLRNSEKMLLISSPSNEWPQQNINLIDDPKSNMASSLATPPPTRVGERIIDQKVASTTTNSTIVHHNHHNHDHHHQDPNQKQQLLQPPLESLRCPRCDSTNTKFCYYNNYSLSQPRHFCKACKRYWTKGGTLRNVPVGGGCRKNKRVKRPSSNINNSSSSSNTTTLNNNNNNNNNNNIINNNSVSLEGSVNSALSGGSIQDLISSNSNHHHHNPLLYGLPNTNNPHSDFNYPYPRYYLQNPSLINGIGLGFSSGLVHNMNSMNIHHNNNKQIFQDLISSSNPLLSNYASTTTTTTTTTATNTTTSTTPPPTISSILASSLIKGGNSNNNFETLLPSYEADLHMKGSGQNGMHVKEVKMEFQGQNRSFDNHHWDTNTTITTTTQNQMDHHHTQPMDSSSNPSILWGTNNGANLGAWLDPSNNLGSSVPSLI